MYEINISPFVVFDCIKEYTPGFCKLVIDKEVLTPPDLERIFGLTGGVRFYLLLPYYATEYISWGYVIRSALFSQTNL